MSAISDMRTTIRVTNEEFLVGIFADEWKQVHVTAFADDPSDIPANRRGACWAGGSAKNRLDSMTEGDNQYFCISLFNSPKGQSLRRKSLFDACFVVVADDVVEKLPLERVRLLPEPSYKLFTSANSEQWGWILNEACEDRAMVDNLLDGLVGQGLAPDGTDPGMKGVTRYVRLPGGSNTKNKRLDGAGNPFKCYLSEYNPDRLYSIESLAEVFGIDLYRKRNEGEVMRGLALDDALVKQHPLITSNKLNITGVGADGWIRIDCVNADAHSDGDASGAAVQIQPDGSVRYQCHHGHCNGDGTVDKMTGPKVVSLLGLSDEVRDYQAEIARRGTRELIAKGLAEGAPQVPQVEEDKEGIPDNAPFDPMDWIYMPTTARFYRISSGEEISSKGLDDLYSSEFNRLKCSQVFVREMNHYAQTAGGYCWVPYRYGLGVDRIERHEGVQMINTWRGYALTPKEGDITLWKDLLAHLVSDRTVRLEVLRWFAYLLQHPADKCQWQLLMRGSKGIGKDLLVRPIMQILGSAGNDISAEQLEGGWGDYFAKRKLVSLQEVYRPQDKKFTNMLKNFAASTGSGIKSWNLKGGAIVSQPDVLSMVAFSNHRHCMALEEGERRWLVLDMFVEPLEDAFYAQYAQWLSGGGASALFYYLLSVDLTGFNPSRVPVLTEAYHDLVEGGKADYEHTLEDMITNGVGVFSVAHFDMTTLVRQLRDAGHSRVGQKKIGEVLERYGYWKTRGRKKIDGKLRSTPNFWVEKTKSGDKEAEIYDFFTRTL